MGRTKKKVSQITRTKLGDALLTNSSCSNTGSPKAAFSISRQRREFLFANLVGRRLTVTTRDGTLISGILSLYGNSSVLPGAWSGRYDEENESADGGSSPASSGIASPTSENAYVFVPPRATVPYGESEGGWKAVTNPKAKRKGGTREESVDPTSSFELYNTFESRLPRPQESSILWLRCAYRTANKLTRSSSRICDWLAVEWAQILTIEALNVPDKLEILAHPFANQQLRRSSVGFATDTEISRGAINRCSRTLQKWTDGEAEAPEDDVTHWNFDEVLSKGKATWDQFAENEKTFGVRSTYVDGMYSTALNLNEIPEEVQKQANRLAEEMEESQRKARSAWSRHEDSGGDDEIDEEARFSAVAGTGHYTHRTPSLDCKTIDYRPPPGRRSFGRGGQRMVAPRVTPGDARGLFENKVARGSESIPAPGVDSRVKVAGRPPPRQLPPPVKKVAETPETDTATKSVKDNINALNLEPIRTREGGANNGAGSRAVASANMDALARRRQKAAELLASSKDIGAKMMRKGWLLPAGSGSSEGAPADKPRPATSSAETETQRAVPPQQTPECRPSTSNSHRTSQAGDSGDEQRRQNQAGFQFNPNANSFTPKDVGVGEQRQHQMTRNAPPQAQPQSSCGSQSKRGSILTFESLNSTATEATKSQAAAEARAARTGGGPGSFVDTFLESARTASSSQVPSTVSPDWSPKLPLSYVDLLETPFGSIPPSVEQANTIAPPPAFMAMPVGPRPPTMDQMAAIQQMYAMQQAARFMAPTKPNEAVGSYPWTIFPQPTADPSSVVVPQELMHMPVPTGMENDARVANQSQQVAAANHGMDQSAVSGFQPAYPIAFAQHFAYPPPQLTPHFLSYLQQQQAYIAAQQQQLIYQQVLQHQQQQRMQMPPPAMCIPQGTAGGGQQQSQLTGGAQHKFV